MNTLNTGVKNVANVPRYTIGPGSVVEVKSVLANRRGVNNGPVIAFIDEYFSKNPQKLPDLYLTGDDCLITVSTDHEPTVEGIDTIMSKLSGDGISKPSAIIGFGGGTTMDTAKAISNLFSNPGSAANYQGWDLLKKPGVFKIGIPTISGTGAEATRTCVMTNNWTGVKLGMNSDYTVFDQLILDPILTETVPRDQYFYTGMDAYIHCVEALSGQYRNAIGDALSRETIQICKEVFNSADMMSLSNRERLMVASYLGGASIATSYVGIVHPFSAGLSVVLGLHHCVANCIVMRAMQSFYPSAYEDFWTMAETQRITIPSGVCANLTAQQYEDLYQATIVHQKPLTNALGESFKKTLTKDKVLEIFNLM